jgi:hypothetical protein
VLDPHHADGVGDRPERKVAAAGVEGVDRREQDALLLHEVRLELGAHGADEPADLG